MSDNFMDNQEVTVSDLTNIAVDLGSTTFSGFSKEKFGVDELNGITADLVSDGILLSLNQCKLTKADDKVTIDTGIIVFKNGAKKRITEALHVDLVVNTYIYALNDTATNTCQIVVSETVPDSTSDYVMLGQVDADGNVLNRRTFSTYNVVPSSGASPIYYNESIILSFYPKPTTYLKRASIEIDSEKASYVAVNGYNGAGGISGFDEDGRTDALDSYSVNSYYESVYFKKNGHYLDIYGRIENAGSSGSGKGFELYVF